jgi:hypothetical protein
MFQTMEASITVSLKSSGFIDARDGNLLYMVKEILNHNFNNLCTVGFFGLKKIRVREKITFKRRDR